MIDEKNIYRIPRGFKESNFNSIKNNIIKFAKGTTNIKDYDYRGSTANSFVGVQAYTILKNQLMSNISILEGNIYTAKDRRNIVAHSQQNGYIPSGVSTSKITLGMICTNKNNDPSIKIPRGSKFQGQQKEGGKTYRFVTLDDVNAIRGEGGTYTPMVDLAQGRIMRIETIYDENVPIIIRDKLIDRNEIRVWVDNARWDNWTYKNVVDITGGSTVFYIRETYDEETEIRFGVGEVTYSKAGQYRQNNFIGGLKPINGSRVVIEYLRTDGFVANGCKIFTFNDVIRDSSVERLLINYNNDPDFIGSVGGGDIEDKESIRENGILSLETQRRAVTDTDWKTILDRKYSPIIQARQVYNPPGAPNVVAVVIKPKGALNLTTDQNREIKAYLDQYKMGRFETVIQKPNYIFVKHNININYSANELMETKDWLEEKVIGNITKFYKENVEFFNTSLHKSKLLTAVDDTNPAIKGTSASFDLVREEDSFYQTSFLGIRFFNRVKQGSFKSGDFVYIHNPKREPGESELSYDIFLQGALREDDKSIIVAGPFKRGDIPSEFPEYNGNDINRLERTTLDNDILDVYYEVGNINHTEDSFEWSFGKIGLTVENFIDPYIEIFATPENENIINIGVGSLIIYEHDLRPQYTSFTWNITQ